MRPRIGSRGSSRRVRQRPARMVSWKDRDAVVETLYRDVDALSPRLKDRRLIRRFAATRDYDPTRTLLLLVEYDKWLAKSGLLDDNLGRDPGVRDEMRRRGTMRLLDPRDAPAVHRAGASIEDAPDERRRLSAQRLTFLQLHTPSMWRTARDKDGCPAVYTNLESYRRGASKDVENTFVWILETVCREMDEDDAEDAAGERHSRRRRRRSVHHLTRRVNLRRARLQGGGVDRVLREPRTRAADGAQARVSW